LISQKEPYISAKEPYISPKEPELSLESHWSAYLNKCLRRYFGVTSVFVYTYLRKSPRYLQKKRTYPEKSSPQRYRRLARLSLHRFQVKCILFRGVMNFAKKRAMSFNLKKERQANREIAAV